jgi:hypothetical protein
MLHCRRGSDERRLLVGIGNPRLLASASGSKKRLWKTSQIVMFGQLPVKVGAAG